jgi:hypothetical protein
MGGQKRSHQPDGHRARFFRYAHLAHLMVTFPGLVSLSAGRSKTTGSTSHGDGILNQILSRISTMGFWHFLHRSTTLPFHSVTKERRTFSFVPHPSQAIMTASPSR